MTTPPVSLDDFRDFLNIRQLDAGIDAELLPKLERATDLVESACGPMVIREVTERVRDIAWDGSFALGTWPVVEVTAITNRATATVVDISALDLDSGTGIVRGVSLSGSVTMGYDVTYTAGRAEVDDLDSIPGPLREATLVIGEQLWQTQRGPSPVARFAQSGTGDAGQVPSYRGFAWPNRATQLVEAYRQPWV